MTPRGAQPATAATGRARIAPVMPWRDATALGVLMNTRGLMEPVVLNVGFELGVISPTLFAMMVLMALVTTCMTSPLLELVLRHAPAAAPAPSTAASA